MDFFLYIIRKKIKGIIRKIKDSIILHLPVYYTDLNKISISKWFKVIEGQKKELYKYSFFKYIPAKFDEIILDMMFQVDNFKIDSLEKRAELAILRSIAIRNKNKSMQFQADCLAKEIELKEKTKSQEKQLTINEFCDYIEITFNQIASINPDKISAGRAFSLFNKAIEHNKRLNNKNK